MILTVTPNSTIDWTIILPYFKWNQTIRSKKAVWGMAGKPADASWILGELGIPNLAIGFAAGIAGEKMITMLQKKGVETDFVWVDGETRINVHLVNEDNGGQSTLVVDTLIISYEYKRQLWELYTTALEDAAAVIIGGSLPKDIGAEFYKEYIQEAMQRGIPVVFDSSDPYLKYGLVGKPTIIKPNRTELQSITEQPTESIEDIYQAAMDIFTHYGTMVIVTLGEKGALAVLGDRAYMVPIPKVEVCSIAGAGDAVLAGIAYALAEKKPLEDGLRLGFAAAGAVILTPGTADCRKADVERLLPTIELIPYHN